MQQFICSLLTKLIPSLWSRVLLTFPQPLSKCKSIPLFKIGLLRVWGSDASKEESFQFWSRVRKFVICDCGGAVNYSPRPFAGNLPGFKRNGGCPFLETRGFPPFPRPLVWQVQTCKGLRLIKMLDI